MSWFDSSGWASMAKTALNNAQKTIDQALDIKDSSMPSSYNRKLEKKLKVSENNDADLFSSFGVSNLISTTSKTFKTKENDTNLDSWSNEWGEDADSKNETSDVPQSENASSENFNEKDQDLVLSKNEDDKTCEYEVSDSADEASSTKVDFGDSSVTEDNQVSSTNLEDTDENLRLNTTSLGNAVNDHPSVDEIDDEQTCLPVIDSKEYDPTDNDSFENIATSEETLDIDEKLMQNDEMIKQSMANCTSEIENEETGWEVECEEILDLDFEKSTYVEQSDDAPVKSSTNFSDDFSQLSTTSVEDSVEKSTTQHFYDSKSCVEIENTVHMSEARTQIDEDTASLTDINNVELKDNENFETSSRLSDGNFEANDHENSSPNPNVENKNESFHNDDSSYMSINNHSSDDHCDIEDEGACSLPVEENQQKSTSEGPENSDDYCNQITKIHNSNDSHESESDDSHDDHEIFIPEKCVPEITIQSGAMEDPKIHNENDNVSQETEEIIPQTDDETSSDVIPTESIVSDPSDSRQTDEVSEDNDVSDSIKTDDESKTATEILVDDSEIQTSSDTLVLSEEDNLDFMNSSSSFLEKPNESEQNEIDSSQLTECAQDVSTPLDFQKDYFELGNKVEVETSSSQEDDHKSEQSVSSSSSLSSFVKLSSSDDGAPKASEFSQSSSDILKIDVDFISGHTSGDEIETTTSSDIEVISSNCGSSISGRDSRSSSSPGKPSPNVESSIESQQSFEKTDSRGSIAIDSHKLVTGKPACSNCQCMNISNRNNKEICKFQSSSFDNKSDLRLRSMSETSSEEADYEQYNQMLNKKISELMTVLEARESKLLEMSKDNVQLKESNMNLEDQLYQLKLNHSNCNAEIENISADCNNKLIAANADLQKVLQEKNEVEKTLKSVKNQFNSRPKPEEIQNALLEKEEQIQELISEGEKLSKQQLQHSNIIKKLRAKEKESEEIMKKLRNNVTEKTQEIESLKKRVSEKSDSEKKFQDNISNMTSSIQNLEKELALCQSNLDDTKEANSDMKLDLERSQREVQELKKANAEKSNIAEEAILSAEINMKEKLKEVVCQAEKAAQNERENLLSQIEEFQLCIARTEKKANSREEILRQEISDLQERLQATECRNDEVSKNISSATRPLLRQIENLQSTLAAQSQSFEAIEKNLTDRLFEAQRQLAVSKEKENIATEKYMEISSHNSAMESQNTSLIRERSMLNSSLETEKSIIKSLEDEKTNFHSEIEILKQNHYEEITILKKSKMEVEMEIALVKEKYETEKKLSQNLKDQIEREKNMSIIMSESSNYSSGRNTPVSLSRFSSVSENPWQQEDLMSQSLMSLSNSQSNKMSVYETLRYGGNTSSLVENLQSQLKQREGEVSHLQHDMSNMDRIRESMSQELVRLSSHNEKLNEDIGSLQVLKNQYKNMESQYNALLQMYGEKVEEADELKMDLQDVKEMYKLQINELLQSK